MIRLTIFLIVFGLFLLSGCPQTRYPNGHFLNVTNYQPDPKKASHTKSGIRYWAPPGVDVRDQVDRLTAELEQCLGTKIRRDWIGVLIPDDAYVSKCSGQWVVPSTPNCKLCIDQKGLPLPEKCCGLRLPTAACPCVCNMRSVLQDNYLIVTTKTLALYKAELTRLITGVNFPWGQKELAKCLKQ